MSIRLVVDNDRNWNEHDELLELHHNLTACLVDIKKFLTTKEHRNANPTAIDLLDDPSQRRD
jgi:hypothetical protein